MQILMSLKTKKPPEGGFSIRLVEAAGIEPASADPPPLDLHAYSIFYFNCLQPDGQGKQTAS
jgi:hypothetical protein